MFQLIGHRSQTDNVLPIIASAGCLTRNAACLSAKILFPEENPVTAANAFAEQSRLAA